MQLIPARLVQGVLFGLFVTMISSVIPVKAESGSYQQAMRQFMQDSAKQDDPFSAEEHVLMERAAHDLAAQMPEPGLKVGEKAPDFTLNDAFGEPVNLYQQLQKGPVILVFYRGAWCPFCNLHLHVLNQFRDRFAAHHAQLVAITPQLPDKSAEQLKKDGFGFRVLSDLDSRVMKDYRLFIQVDDRLLQLYKKHGLDLEAFNGKGRTVLPAPGTFVIDQKGIVRAVQADTDYTRRMEPEAVLKALTF